MQIKELFKRKNLVFSFEVFPPKVTSPIGSIYDTLEGLQDLKPDYISVTYGAGGNGNDNRTGEIAAIIKNKYGIEALAHLTCIGSTLEQTKGVLQKLRDKGVHNVLALRGDIPEGFEGKGELKNSQDLIRLIREDQGNRFGIAAACYPEGHVEGKNVDQDIEILKIKEEAGADHAITQLFFDNNYFYEFLNKVEEKGIQLPIQAGIMPVTNKKQIERIVALSGANLPVKFKKIMEKYEHNKEALRDAGIAYALDQIVDLISTGARGIHLYTMNNPYIARSVSESIHSILKSVNKEKEVV